MGNCSNNEPKPPPFQSPINTDYKCILMGPKRSGKTTFFTTFMNNPMKKFTDKDLDTNYEDIIAKNFFSYTFILNEDVDNNSNHMVPLTKIKINLWDLAGDKDLHIKNITKNMMHFTDGVFLLFDLTNEQSFNDLSSEWWPMLESVIDMSQVKGMIYNQINCDLFFFY